MTTFECVLACHCRLDRRFVKSGSSAKAKMFRQILKRFTIRQFDYKLSEALRASSNKAGKIDFEVKINHQNESIELHEASGQHRKFEFPFLYLRDNCQV